MAEKVRKLHTREHQIATVWHPEPRVEVLETHLGNVRVLQGDPKVQLTTGEVKEI